MFQGPHSQTDHAHTRRHTRLHTHAHNADTQHKNIRTHALMHAPTRTRTHANTPIHLQALQYNLLTEPKNKKLINRVTYLIFFLCKNSPIKTRSPTCDLNGDRSHTAEVVRQKYRPEGSKKYGSFGLPGKEKSENKLLWVLYF